MKRRLFFIFLFAIFGMASFGQYVTIQGRQFKDENGNDLYPVVCNYSVNVVNTDPNNFLTTFISPEHSWSTNNYFECNNEITCDQCLQNDFLQLLSMGFNTIRLMGINPTHLPEGTLIQNTYDSLCDWTCPVTGFYVNTLNHSLQDCQDDTRFLLHEPFTDDTSTRFFEHLAHFITLVSQTTDTTGNRLKVILVTGGGGGYYLPDVYPNAYGEYLEAFSQAFMTLLPPEAQSTILAYDLDNEPKFSWDSWSLWPSVQYGHTKEDVCNNVKLWDNALKTHDPNHLITLGGHGLADIFEFDPTVMTLDFYSLHVYPLKREYEDPDYFDPMVNRIFGHFYWNKNHMFIPWIIGETGFTAQHDSVFPSVDGSLEEQLEYADSTLPAVWNCDGSGYSWWTYQNFHWGSAAQNFFGILDYGECSPVPCDQIAKPVHQAFEDFIPPQGPFTCAEPVNYFDPYQHAVYSPNTHIVTGRVIDQDSLPIANAIIEGWTRLYDKDGDDKKPVWNVHYTFTDSTGNFTLIPFDYDTLAPDYNTIERIKISATSCSREYQKCDDPRYGIDSNQTFQLTRSEIPIEETFEDITVFANQTVTVQAWNSVNVSDVVVESLGTCDISAGREINVRQEFHAQTNSETRIHIDMPCSGAVDLPMQGNKISSSDGNDLQDHSEEIRLQFAIPEPSLVVEVFPNPGMGIFSVRIRETILSTRYIITVYDQLTNIVHQRTEFQTTFEVDLSSLTPGVYFMKIDTPNQSQTKKMIII